MVGYKDGREVKGGSGLKGGTCQNDKPGHVGDLPFPLAAGAYMAGGGVDERSSLPLSLPRPLPCPFLPLPLPLSIGLPLPLPLPLAMSESGGLKSRISIERNGSVAGSSAVPGAEGRRGVVPWAPIQV